MLLIISLDLIGNFALVSDDRDVWTPTINNLDFSKLGTSVLTCFLLLKALLTAAWYFI